MADPPLLQTACTISAMVTTRGSAAATRSNLSTRSSTAISPLQTSTPRRNPARNSQPSTDPETNNVSWNSASGSTYSDKANILRTTRSQTESQKRSSAYISRASHLPSPPLKRRRISYKEESDSDEDDVDKSEDEAHANSEDELAQAEFDVTPTKKYNSATKALKKAPRQPSDDDKIRDSAKGGEEDQPFIPNWLDPRMEHGIWVEILAYAADTGDHEKTSTGWLLSVASKTCRVLGEAAITALYEHPLLRTEHKILSLIHTLEISPTVTRWNYRPKIKSLHLDVQNFPIWHNNRGSDMFVRLIRHVPNLAHMELFHVKDQPPYRALDDNIRWDTPMDLFHALEGGDNNGSSVSDGTKRMAAKLSSWKWSSRITEPLPGTTRAETIQILHRSVSLRHLKKVSFVNFQVPSLTSKTDPIDPQVAAADQLDIETLAAAITELKDLEHLVFESSTVVNAHLLPLLPKTLKRLELINCWDLGAEEFGEFLLTHGSNIEYLILNHNQSLNLSFLQHLAEGCPKLRELRMNLTYFRHHEMYDDSTPMYESLLLVPEVPTWPSTIEVIDLANLNRFWTVDAADMLMQSLVNGAPKLPMLRHLSISANLDVPWRSRSEIRQGWKDKLTKVFLRPYVPPLKRITLRPQPTKPLTTPIKKRKASKPPSTGTRRSGRLASQWSEPSSRASSVPRDLRLLSGTRPSYQEPDSDEFDSEGDPIGVTEMSDVDSSFALAGLSAAMPPVEKKPFVQGLCNVVEVVIHNGHQGEHKYGMADFLDDWSTDNDDDEWEGDLESDAEELAF
jgi:hypothetical protein